MTASAFLDGFTIRKAALADCDINYAIAGEALLYCSFMGIPKRMSSGAK